MNNNHFTKALISIGAFLFVIDHPLLFSLGCLAYFVIQNINIEETMALKNYINNGNDWVKELNQQAREIEVPLTTPRNILSELWDRIQNEFTSEQIQSLQNNSFVEDKLIDTIKKEFAEQQYQEEIWVESSVNEWMEEAYYKDSIIDIIKYFLPSYDCNENFTQQHFKKLIKTIKTFVRNPDGSIKEECTLLHNDLKFIELEILIYFDEGNVLSHLEQQEKYSKDDEDYNGFLYREVEDYIRF